MEIDLAAARKASDGRRQQLATKFEPRAACGDRMVELVERMLELHKRKARCSGDVSSPKSANAVRRYSNSASIARRYNSEQLLGIEQQGDGAVVDELDVHHGAKRAGFHLNALGA
jgi:hypothetical protein